MGRTVFAGGGWRVAWVAVCVVVAVGTPLAAQTEAFAGVEESDEPVPYTPEEFPQWSRDLRRAEIIAVGTFPIAMIVSGLFYDLGRYTYYSIREGESQSQYAPGFISPEGGVGYNEDERIGLIVAGVSVSLIAATVDYLLGRRARRIERERRRMIEIEQTEEKSSGGLPLLPTIKGEGSSPEG